jgi:uncharacterized damage-inducible protein DinB
MRRLFLRTLNSERLLTVQVISAVPPTQCDYRPDPDSRTALQLSWHIVDAEIMFLDVVAGGTFTRTRPLPASVVGPADVVAWYHERFEDVYARLQQASDETLARTIALPRLLARPAVLFLQTAIHHSIHHRGQLSAYLRPMGGTVPPIYGDSHDRRAR